jgi:hypothetical protein
MSNNSQIEYAHHKNLLIHFKEKFICKNCHQTIERKNSFGQLDCKRHPKQIIKVFDKQTLKTYQKYECCNKIYDGFNKVEECNICDHYTKNEILEQYVEIPVWYFINNKLKLPKEENRKNIAIDIIIKNDKEPNKIKKTQCPVKSVYRIKRYEDEKYHFEDKNPNVK